MLRLIWVMLVNSLCLAYQRVYRFQFGSRKIFTAMRADGF